MSTYKLKDYVQATANIFQILAITIGGVWGYSTWIKQSSDFTKTNVNVESYHESYWSEKNSLCMVQFYVRIENIGTNTVELKPASYALYLEKYNMNEQSSVQKVKRILKELDRGIVFGGSTSKLLPREYIYSGPMYSFANNEMEEKGYLFQVVVETADEKPLQSSSTVFRRCKEYSP